MMAAEVHFLHDGLKTSYDARVCGVLVSPLKLDFDFRPACLAGWLAGTPHQEIM
jgi:hypothetical protein